MAALRLCRFAALRLARSMAALRLARSMAALRLCGLSVPWRLCGFAALTLFRVRACTRTRVQWFLSAFFSFQASLSFKSCLVLSAPLIRLQPLPNFRWTPADFRWKSFFRFSMLFFRLRRPLFRSSPALFVRLLSFV